MMAWITPPPPLFLPAMVAFGGAWGPHEPSCKILQLFMRRILRFHTPFESGETTVFDGRSWKSFGSWKSFATH
jgi:hypothetical protein